MEGKSEVKMSYNFLGKSGLKVSNLCLGTMSFGKNDNPYWSYPNQSDEDLSHQMLDRFVECGGNFIDTADAYGNGKSEEHLGTWLSKQQRDRYVIGTKVRLTTDGSNPNKTGLSRWNIMQACDASLKRLQTEYIDLYQTHLWDSGTSLEETYGALNDLVRCGKIRYVGVSNVCGWQLQKIVDVCKYIGLSPIIGLQQQYSLLCRVSEKEEFQVCQNEGIGIMPWSPLCSGMLAGKYKRGQAMSADNSRVGYLQETKIFSYWDRFGEDDKYWKLIDILGGIAKEKGKTIAQVSLRWLLQKKQVTSVVIGATKLSQLDDNIGASTGWELSQEEMEKLDDASAIESSYPHSLIDFVNLDRVNPFLK